MDEKVKRLVAELPSIVQLNTKRSYDDVQKILTSLQKYVKENKQLLPILHSGKVQSKDKTFDGPKRLDKEIEGKEKRYHQPNSNSVKSESNQRPMATRPGVVRKLDNLEALLSVKYQEKNQNIFKHTQKIRQISEVGMKGNSGNTSCENNGIVGGGVGNDIPDAAGQRAGPKTGIPSKKSVSVTRNADCKRGSISLGSKTKQSEAVNRASRIIVQNTEETYHDERTNEMLFLEDCLIRLQGMFNDDTKDNGEIIPAPKTNIMKTVRTLYSYLVDVVGKIRRLKFENQHMKMIISGLHKHLIDGEEKPQMDLNLPKDMQIDLSTLELKKNAEEVAQTFNEFKTASEKIKGERNCLLSIFEALHNETQYLSEGKTCKDLSALVGQMTSSIDKESTSYEILRKAGEISNIQMEWKREAEYAVQLLEELNKFSKDSIIQETETTLSKPPEHVTLAGSSSSKDDLTSKNQIEKTSSSRHVEQLNKTFATATNVLKKHMAVEKLQKENDSLQSKLDGLLKEINNPNEGKTQDDVSSEVDQTESSCSNDNSHHESCIQSREISNLQTKCESLRSDIKTKTEQLEDMTGKQKQLSEQNSELVKQVNSLRTRLSELAGAKLTHGNASIADLSDPNRPTKLAEMYSELYSNQWTDAFEYLSKTNPEESDETLICCLYAILKDGYCFCQKIRESQKLKLAEIMFLPAECTQENEVTQTDEVSEILSKHLSEAAKLSSNMACSNIFKAFVAKKEMKKMYRKMLEPCRTYIEECVKLCWYMQVQTPPVCIDLKTAKGHSFVKDMYREYTAKGQRIAYVVWPALFLHYKGPMLVKGVAQGE